MAINLNYLTAIFTLQKTLTIEDLYITLREQPKNEIIKKTLKKILLLLMKVCMLLKVIQCQEKKH